MPAGPPAPRELLLTRARPQWRAGLYARRTLRYLGVVIRLFMPQWRAGLYARRTQVTAGKLTAAAVAAMEGGPLCPPDGSHQNWVLTWEFTPGLRAVVELAASTPV